MSQIGGGTRLAGVVGEPIEHSLSPLIHNAWLAVAGIDAAYVAFPVPSDRFGPFVEGLRGGVLAGLNVTAPFKRQALDLADRASPAARRAGSANLLCFPADGQVIADNTDGQGLLDALDAAAPDRHRAGAAAILGAGGAARAAAAALLDSGAASVQLFARSGEKAVAVAADLGPGASGAVLEEAEAAMPSAALLVNATPAGALDSALTQHLVDRLAGDAVVMDMIYRPLVTALLQVAARRGLRVVDGLAMLIAQAAPSFATFFGRPPPPLDVRALALAGLAEAPNR